MQQRSFLKILVLGIGGISSLIVAGPAIATAFSPVLRRNRGPAWRSLGPVEQFALGAVERAMVEVHRNDWATSLRSKGVYVLRQSSNEIVVFSRNCTDLSCPITWDPGCACFFCPCHGGIFTKTGVPIAGPPKRPLYRYATRIRDGQLEIDVNSLPVIT